MRFKPLRRGRSYNVRIRLELKLHRGLRTTDKRLLDINRACMQAVKEKERGRREKENAGVLVGLFSYATMVFIALKACLLYF